MFYKNNYCIYLELTSWKWIRESHAKHGKTGAEKGWYWHIKHARHEAPGAYKARKHVTFLYIFLIISSLLESLQVPLINMTAILLMSAKLTPPALLEIKLFWLSLVLPVRFHRVAQLILQIRSYDQSLATLSFPQNIFFFLSGFFLSFTTITNHGTAGEGECISLTPH